MIQRILPRPEDSFADDDCLVVADTHTHVYPCYDVERFFQRAFGQLGRHAQFASKALLPSAMLHVLFLAERWDCHFFEDLAQGRILLPESDLSAEATSEPEGILVSREERAILLIQGYQIQTRERIEVLALAATHRPEDGQDLDDTVAEVLQTGAIPVLPWALGKWMFQRGARVYDILNRADPDELLLGDSSLRPRGLPRPRIFQRAEHRNFTILHGSDPLPFPGEEEQVGSYVSAWVQPLNESRPIEGLRQYLRLSGGAPQPLGGRNSPFSAFLRLYHNARAARAPQTGSAISNQL